MKTSEAGIANRLTVSCVVPARDAACYIREALESVLAQTYRPIEVLVVDDGSEDETARLARGLWREITVLSQPASGPAAARNRGLGAAQGSFVTFLDADDTWHPEKLARQMALLRSQPDVGISLCHVQPVTSPALAPDDARLDLQSPVKPATLVARREIFATVGGFNPSLRYTDVIDWLTRARLAGITMEVLAEPLYYCRVHARNMSWVEAAAARAEILHLVREKIRG